MMVSSVGNHKSTGAQVPDFGYGCDARPSSLDPAPPVQPELEVDQLAHVGQKLNQEIEAAIGVFQATAAITKSRVLAMVQEKLQQVIDSTFNDPQVQSTLSFNSLDENSTGPSVGTYSSQNPSVRALSGEADVPQTEDAPVDQSVELSDKVTAHDLEVDEQSSPRSDQLNGELYEGRVKLRVQPRGCVRTVLDFVDELCQKPQLHLVQLVGTAKGGLDIWVGLREQMALQTLIQSMPAVTYVVECTGDGSVDQGRCIEVQLTDLPSTNAD